MNASGGVYWRSSPDWNTPEPAPGNRVYPGTIIKVSCYQAGAANVPGSADSMWEQATWVSGPGGGSGWINEHFINDGAAINQSSPGAVACSPPPPPPPPPPSPPPPPPPPPTQSINIGWSGLHLGWIWMTLNGFSPGAYPYSCDFGSGGDATFTLVETVSPQTWDNGHTCYDFIHGDTVWVTVGGVRSNTIVVP
jgi:hypothetical protein